MAANTKSASGFVRNIVSAFLSVYYAGVEAARFAATAPTMTVLNGLTVAAGQLAVSAGTAALGVAGTAKGVLTLAGVTSGVVTIQPADAAGTYTLTLPADDGDSGEQLQTNGSGVLTWEAAGSLREVKAIAGEMDRAAALQAIVDAPVYRFRYLEGARPTTGDYATEYVGVVADEAPWVMHHNGRIFNPVSAAGYSFAAIQELERRLSALEGKPAKRAK